MAYQGRNTYDSAALDPISVHVCPCGSGELREAAFDARGIFLASVCRKCRKQTLARYRSDVLTNPNYECDEPIEPDDY